MARVKLAYPKMRGSRGAPLERCIAFEKYDGTNLHWMWERELGWHAFGTRRDRFDLDEAGIVQFTAAHEELGEAPHLFWEQWADPLLEVFAQHNLYEARDIMVFTEFLGDDSFAGRHRAEDDKRLVLFDVQADDRFLPPETFVEHYASLPIARVVYRGKLTGKFANDVREGRYDVAEGVVCKGGDDGGVWMAKIKTNAYMKRLKEAFADDWESYWE